MAVDDEDEPDEKHYCEICGTESFLQMKRLKPEHIFIAERHCILI